MVCSVQFCQVETNIPWKPSLLVKQDCLFVCSFERFLNPQLYLGHISVTALLFMSCLRFWDQAKKCFNSFPYNSDDEKP